MTELNQKALEKAHEAYDDFTDPARPCPTPLPESAIAAAIAAYLDAADLVPRSELEALQAILDEDAEREFGDD